MSTGIIFDSYHRDDVTVIGEPHPTPGGHESTALNAVNYVSVDYDAVARRNNEDTRKRITLRLEHEKKADLTTVV